jgi:Zinc finger, C3HC4 type (RING finger)
VKIFADSPDCTRFRQPSALAPAVMASAPGLPLKLQPAKVKPGHARCGILWPPSACPICCKQCPAQACHAVIQEQRCTTRPGWRCPLQVCITFFPLQVIDLTDDAAPMPAPRQAAVAGATNAKRHAVPGPLFVEPGAGLGGTSSRQQPSAAKARPSVDEEEPRCAICLEGLKENLASAPCGHVFHHQCLKSSFAKFKYCPRCRKAFRAEKQIHKIFF